MTMLLMFNIRYWGFVCILLAMGVLLAACSEEAVTPVPTAVQTPSPEVVTAPLPSPTPAPVALSPLATESEAIVASGLVTVTTPATNTVFVPVVRTEAGECLLETDVDLAGYAEVESKMGCPSEPASFEPVGINEFGPGPEFDRFMLWFSAERRIYVLYPDQKWDVFDDTWTEDQPTFSCNPLGGTPESPPLPRRGFGKLWCTMPELQEIMGTISVEERLCQHSAVQRFELGRLLACYEDATIRYIRLLDDGTWDTVLTR